jgi:hypothetical protein
MATLYKAHVRHGVQVPDPLPDVRDELAGRFIGRVPPEAPVGSYGNVHHLRREGRGTFRGDSDRQRQGSFGDHDLTDADSALQERFLRTPDAA